MQFSFQSAGDFLDEVAVYVADKTIEENLVRLQIEIQQSRDYPAKYAVRAGFLRGNGDLYQFYEDCGQSPAKYGDDDGKLKSSDVCALIRDTCESLGCTVRKGMCVG